MAAGFKTVHYSAIHRTIHTTNHHTNHKAYYYHASGVHFNIAVRPRSSALQPRKRRSTQHQCPVNKVNLHNPFLNHKAGE
jgi:hypothetical protein